MAVKRMFSSSVTETDSFLELPLKSQALYFHLGMQGDDDGFVEALGNRRICHFFPFKSARYHRLESQQQFTQ